MISLDGLVAFLFGLVIGSFVNVCISRIPKKVSVVRPRSACPHCDEQIRWWHNVPLLSYLWLGGKCASCGEAISIRYPIVELLTGLILVLTYGSFGWSILFLSNAIFFSLLITLLVIDLYERLLPDVLTINGTMVGFILAPVQAQEVLDPIRLTSWPIGDAYLAAAVGILAGGGILWLVAALYVRLRGIEGLGFGDVKLMAMVGAFMGWKGAWMTIFLGSFAGAIVGSLYIFLSSRGRQYELPFGTFLGLAAIMMTLYGPALIAWYAGSQ